MKYIAIILATILACSCSTNPEYTGQRFIEASPIFYLSIAPSFSKPCEYEVQDKTLIFREYSGFGGYDWGIRRTVATSDISQEAQDEIRALTLKAIADAISIENRQRESDEIVIVLDGTRWYVQSDIGPFLSISTSNPESEAFRDLRVLLDSILGRRSDDVESCDSRAR